MKAAREGQQLGEGQKVSVKLTPCSATPRARHLRMTVAQGRVATLMIRHEIRTLGRFMPAPVGKQGSPFAVCHP